MVWHRAKILSRRQLSPTVTGLTLQIINHQPTNSTFTFLPGQWLDFRPLPSATYGGKNIGGYSITSVPQYLPQLDLAIQSSRHPVAQWVTHHAQPHDLVDVQIGGNFTYQSNCNDNNQQVTAPMNRLLFIAGGVGINPLFSMIQQWHMDQTNKNNRNSRAVLLFSGRESDELLFQNELGKLMDDKPDQFRVFCTTTNTHQLVDNSKEDTSEGGAISGSMVLQEGRIDLPMIRDAVRWINKGGDILSREGMLSQEETTHEQDDNMIADEVFVCGPPGMPECITRILSEEKFVRSTRNVHFEKWW